MKGRQFDYPFGANLNYVPRSEGGISFAELRALADALPLLRAVIETRKDQVAAQNFTVRPRARADVPDASPRIERGSRASSPGPTAAIPSRDWLRMLLEDLLVIDAATIYPRYNRARRALFARPGRRRDDQAADRRGRARARAARSGLSAGAARRPGGGFFGRRAALPAAQSARAQALRHVPTVMNRQSAMSSLRAIAMIAIRRVRP